MTTHTPGLNNLAGTSAEQFAETLAFPNLYGVAPAGHKDDTPDIEQRLTDTPIILPLGVLPDKPYLHGGSGPSAS